MSSTLASALLGHVSAVHYERDSSGQTTLWLRYDEDARLVVLKPNADARRFDYGVHEYRRPQGEESTHVWMTR